MNYSKWALALVIVFLSCGKAEVPKTTNPDPTPNPGNPITPNPTEWKAGDVIYDNSKFNEVIVGNIPLVLSIPHGGTLNPSGIPNRSCPGITTVRDSYTIELGRAIQKEFKDTYNVIPYIVINHVSRTKIDPNREIEEATCGNEIMKLSYRKYHEFIDKALKQAVQIHGQAIIIDLHGHGHTEQRLEIGYSLSAQELRGLDSLSNLNALQAKSSLNNWFQFLTSVGFIDAIAGDHAFGTKMASEGFPSVPSKQDPSPKVGESYFNGGHITRFYTSSSYPKVYGWQIECNNRGVRDNDANRAAFAKSFAKVMMEYTKNI